MILEQTIRFEVGEANAPTQMTWDEATAYCSNLGDGWRLPTKDELALMYQHKDELGGCGKGWLWSSSLNGNGSDAWEQRFSDGNQDYNYKDYRFGVRAVRDLMVRQAPTPPEQDARELVNGWWVEWMDSLGPDSLHETPAEKLAAAIERYVQSRITSHRTKGDA